MNGFFYLKGKLRSSGTLSGCLGGASQLTCTYTPADDFIGQVVFSYKANDGQRDSETVSVVVINVVYYNTKPMADAGSNQDTLSGVLVTLDGSGSSDPEGETLTYHWELPTRPLASRAQLANPHSVDPVFITDRDGIYIARLIVNDGKLDSLPSEVTITVTGESNEAPVLSTITSPQTIEMGTELRFTLSGSDTDTNDSLTFLATNLPENSRLDGATGKFRFTPSPSQVEDHTVTFTVTDGQESHSQDVVFTVEAAEADQVTALKSRVLDGNAYSAGEVVPISGVTISVEGSTVTTTTDANGEFTISGIPHGAQIVSLDATGLTASNGHQYANFKGRLKILPNVLNRPHRDYMLPRVNPDHISMVNPARATTVSNSDIGVSMTVPAETVMSSDGTMYSGPLSISMVPIDATPRELPEEFNPSLLITLQPVGMSFTTPVPITFPNTDNLAADTLLDLFSLSERGGFEKVGLGIVSSDGQTISIVEGGIRSTTWHFTSVSTPSFSGISSGSGGGGSPSDSGDGNGDGNGDPGDVTEDVVMDSDINNTEVSNCEGSFICVSTGALREEHSLPSFSISGLRNSSTLAYANTNSLQSLTLIPIYKYQTRRVRVGGAVFRNVVESPPRSMGMSFELEGRVTPEVFFNTTPIVGGGGLAPFTSSHHLNTEGLKTGVYEVTARLNLISGSGTNISRRMRKNRFYYPVISPETEFGMGWRLKELQSLHGMNGELDASHKRVMLVLDNFRYLVFRRNSDGSYTSPKGDYSTLKALPAPFNGFLRETKEGETYVFDSEGALIGKTDRYERRTSYLYLSDGKLLQIVYDNGTSTVFSYGSDGLIESITDPAGRVTRLTRDTQQNLTQIMDPDNNSRGFEYNANHTLIAQTDKISRAKNYAYDTRRSVIHSVQSDNTFRGIKSSNTKLTAEGLGTPLNPFMIAMAEGRFSVFSDAKGNDVRLETNEFGAITRRVDAMDGQQFSPILVLATVTHFKGSSKKVFVDFYPKVC